MGGSLPDGEFCNAVTIPAGDRIREHIWGNYTRKVILYREGTLPRGEQYPQGIGLTGTRGRHIWGRHTRGGTIPARDWIEGGKLYIRGTIPVRDWIEDGKLYHKGGRRLYYLSFAMGEQYPQGICLRAEDCKVVFGGVIHMGDRYP